MVTRRFVAALTIMAAALILASGIALAATQFGGPGRDRLEGTEGRDWLDGGGGDDKVDGEDGDDSIIVDEQGNPKFDKQGNPVGGNLIGGLGDDKVYGDDGHDDLVGSTLEEAIAISARQPVPYEPDNGADKLHGGDGEDRLFGGGGADKLHGGDGDDDLADGENVGGARDKLYGGPGDDFFLPRNIPAVEDEIHCGQGYDIVFADEEDDIRRDCEKTFLRNPYPREACIRCDGAEDDGKGRKQKKKAERKAGKRESLRAKRP